MGILQVIPFSKTNSIPLMVFDDKLRMHFPVVLLVPGLPNLDGIGRKFVRQCIKMATSAPMCNTIDRMSFSLVWNLLSLI